MFDPKPKVKSVKSKPLEKPKILEPERPLEMVVRVNMKDKGLQHVNVYEGDTPNDVAKQFCRKHEITDREKQYKLLKSLEHQINTHREQPDDNVYENAAGINDRDELNPVVK